MKQRQAFTLIELLIAVVLGAMLLVAVIAVMRLATDQQERLRRWDQYAESNGMLMELIRRDVTNSDSILIANNSLWLEGGIARDPISGNSIHQQALVHYHVGSIQGRSVLFRTQVSRLNPTRPTISTDPLWTDIVAIKVLTNSMEWETADSENVSNDAFVDDSLLVSNAGQNSPPPPGRMSRTAGSVRLQIVHQDGFVILDETVIHHTEVN